MTGKKTPTALTESWDLNLLEGDAGDGYFNSDGTVNMVLIRPCNGRGVGARIYEAEMLERDAHVFAGLPMFDNHDSEQARRARGNLPRAPSEVGGAVLETWWEPEFVTPRDAEMEFGKGAVIGRCMLREHMEELVRKMPQVLKTSINAQASGLKPGTRNGKKGQVVEGIVRNAQSSVDLVTAAGAGGEVAHLMEALVDDGHTPENVRNDRRDVADPTGDDVTEAEVRALIDESMKPVQDALTALPNQITEAVTTAVEGQRDTLHSELRESLEQPTVVRGLAEYAAAVIEAETFAGPAAAKIKAKLLADFGATGTGVDIVPGPRLAVLEAQTDANGTVTKSLQDVLKDAIVAEAAEQRGILAEAAPSTPRSFGAPAGAGQQPAGGQAPQAVDIPVPVSIQLMESAQIGTSHLIEAPAEPKTGAAA